MIKKLIALNLLIVLVFSAFSFGVNASSSSPVYSITVDGVLFKSNEDASGNGWSYSAEESALTLDGYAGSSIIASGDLVVYAKNDVEITGTSSEKYGSSNCGIVVTGSLTLNASNSNITITGAENSGVKGGEGIVAAKAVISSKSGSELNVFGGNDAVAIKANELILSTYSLNAFGGEGASGIYFSSSFAVESGTNAMIKAGGDKYAITYLKNASYIIDKEDINVTFRDNSSVVVFESDSNFIYGDCNGDGNINSMDAVLLAQYLAKWKVDPVLEACDTNADGEIGTRDVVLLAQYLAKWQVTLGK